VDFHRVLNILSDDIQKDYGREYGITEIKLTPALFDRIASDVMKEKHELWTYWPSSFELNCSSYSIRIVKDPEAAKEDLRNKLGTILRLVESNNLGKDFVEELKEELCKHL
jgi:hypothetical protein